ncbi:2-amino-4-hydroxy-6-hydroxymethyldihydropteridine diphosphokinase [Aliidiomarina celeris]|uniref:2-amino-4-hydroxy-6- hydroxymethyldihydropteridine diphosphokinase n=1 Tax=Aliidiomarina celeris TaxID=2249428 RepID=UPI000DEAF41D|nr:2-amino-4-hydroxy-6-hydroxymethyldihydropteridine diphosphokinase [Aliidiomarina celeris]
MPYYYLSLGSNIEPAKNIAAALERLRTDFGNLHVFPVVRTEPTAMSSARSFLNTLAVIQSHLDAGALKAYFNALEESAGRDRSDPDRSVKDRQLDIDILTESSVLDFELFKAFDEPYTQSCVEALHDDRDTVTLHIHNQPIGHALVRL